MMKFLEEVMLILVINPMGLCLCVRSAEAIGSMAALGYLERIHGRRVDPAGGKSRSSSDFQ